MLENFFDFSNELLQLDNDCMKKCMAQFKKIDEIKEYNQLKMLKAFKDCGVASNHLVGTTGYGYDDIGREKLDSVFAKLTGSEDALFRHNFMSGTHTIAVALFGLLRTGDTMLCVTGKPYDTLCGVIGLNENAKNEGSLKDFGVKYEQIDLKNGKPNYTQIAKKVKNKKICYIQRSRGYADRPSLSIAEIEKISNIAKQNNPNIWVVVDNCYGEFTQIKEPTQAGADLIIGSLIKNPGGGIAPTGGYIAGKKELVELCSYRLTTPGTGREIGCTMDILRQLYLGLYFAPQVTAEALKTSIYASLLFSKLGFETTPSYKADRNDIVTSIKTNTSEELECICRGIQAGSPVDSFVTPVPWAMPGYDNEVIMAAGAFTMGSSIELSCDAPIREPYIVYMQGGLNFASGRAGVLLSAQNILNSK